jgi:hypothetical protein
MQQVSVLETNIGSSTTGNSSNTQVIFNDNGTLRGDAGLTYSAATDTLTVGAATITGDLTVDTSTLKVDSTNNRVGILTASPAYPLQVAGRISYAGAIGEGADTTVSSSGTSLLIGNSATWTDTQLFAGGNLQYRVQSSGVFTWLDGAGGTRMTLNSTGLGVGVTPSAWNSAAKAIQSSQGAVASNGITTWFGSNVFYDSTYTPKYIGTNFAGSIVYNPAGFGGWDFNIAASGTAGNTITFTTPMKLDSLGNLILQTPATPATLTTNGQLTVNATSNTNLRFSYRGSDGTTRVANITLA